MTELAELLADCDARGIRLHPAGDGGLTIDAPQAALTPDMLARLKCHKVPLLALLGPARGMAPAPAMAAQSDPPEPTTPVCRCGSTTWRDVRIHEGQTVRRDCDRCRRFLDFPVWHGKSTLQNEK
jgi:hypothetical protein